MQPPPQAAPSGVVGPPPVGNPQNVFWSNSTYRRRVNGSTPVAPVTGPLQPVTDPFAFSRQVLQNTSLGGLSKSSPPIMQGPALSQHPGLPAPHTDARDPSRGPREPLPRPFSQPRPDASPPWPVRNSNSDTGPSSGPDVQPTPHPVQHIPGVGPDGSHGGHPHGGMPGPDGPLRRQHPPRGAAAPAASSFFPQPHQQMPDLWGPVQGSPQPSGQQYPPCPDGAVQNAVPLAPGIPHVPPQPAVHQTPGYQQHNPLVSLPGPWASDERNEATYLQSGSHLAKGFEPDNPFGQTPTVGNPWAGQELRQNPGVNQEHLPEPAPVTALAQGNSPENHLHYPLGAGASCAQPEAGLGSLSVFFQGGETENEETLPSEKTGLASKSDFEAFPPSLGVGHPLPPPPVGAGGIYQALLKGSSSEATQQGGDMQPYFPQPAGSRHDRQVPKNAAVDMWGDTASAGVHDAIGPHHENIENLEFLQNQEVLPSEPLGVNSSSLSEPFRSGPEPGLPAAKHGAGNLAGGGGTNLEAPDVAPQPVQSDSVSSSYGSKNHRGLSSSTRPQELLGTFIQQEVGKPEEDVSGSFFKQIDSSPIGGEADETTASPNYRHCLSQPSTPSPPKPIGIFQTSANSSFEPVKSHLVGVKPIEADRANVVGEVRGTRARQKKRKPVAVPPDASPGNLEQPPDNMETLFTPQLCALPPAAALHTAGPPLETVLPAPEKRPPARAQGAAKCESPATTLWAQNELPDFGGNVLLAPAAPALYVPAKPQPSEVIQPPDEGASSHQLQKPGSVPPLQNQDGLGASENLENPPKLGEEEALQSQASSGYASLLSSPPTESLQNQPVLIAQPDQSYNLAQPINFSMSLSHHNEKSRSWKDVLVGGDNPTLSGRAPGGDPGEKAPLSGNPAGPLISLPLSSTLAQSNFPQASGTSEVVSNQPASLLVQPPSHPVPVNLVPKSQKSHSAENILPEFVTSPAGGTGVVLVPPVNTASVPVDKASHSGTREEISGAIDFLSNQTLENPVRMYSPPHSDGPAATHQTVTGHPRQAGPGVHDPGHFYPQVTKDMQDQKGLERARQDSEPLQQQASAPHVPQATCSEASDPASPPAQGQSQSSARPPASPAPADTSQQLLSRPPRSSSASVVSTGSSQAAGRSEQPWQHLTPSSALGHPPQDLSYYYYRPLYDAYTAQYPSLYLSDPGTASLYYQQDVYGLYEPRYRPYDGSASAYAENYRYPEPERPSSRASHSSDRPPPRQAFPDGYYNAKGGWSSQSDYYANYYSSQYDYGDPSRWDRYHYDSRFRDPRSSDRRYWYGADDDPYRKELFAYGGDRPESDEGRWRYDPRFTGSFDDDPEPPRDPYGDEGDRRSVHSEHSAHSLRSTRSLQSRRSSFSSHSHQSRIYRSHHMPASSCEVPAPPGSFQGDYAYGTYGGNFSPAQGFSEYGYAADTGWPAAQQAPSRPTSPEKFSVPHICARFGPGGQLIKVIPNLPSEGQPALVEVHSMETLLQHTPEQEEMRSFPGPLGKEDTHKVDVINFAQNKATKCFQNENLIDKESASLLWNFIVLLCRQNGTVVGTDIAELLLRDHKTVWLPGKSPNEANLIDFTNEAVEQAEEEESGEAQLSFLTDSQTAATSSLEKETERFRELLLYGRKKDALESAMKNALWGHALLLASKMDSRTHARVMTRFANSLPINDPLQTVYQLMSGRMPAASTCCGDEKWGDWRPHLAMVLSNLNNNMDVESRTMATMGDTLASKGLLDAAHFCYLMAQVGFGVYTKKTTKLVLIGSNHSLPFLKFATNEAIQRTEAYEYAQSLGARTCPLPSFQVFKFIYSCRLAEMGLATQAFHYCEVIAKSILPEPHRFSPVLVSQLVQVALQLRLFDPQLKEKPEEEWFVEPAWLVQLQLVEKQIKEGAVVWRQDGALPQQCPSTPSSEMEQDEGLEAEQPLLALPLPGAEPASRSMLLPPSAPQMLPDGQPANPARAPLFPGPPPPGSGQPGPACRPPVSTLGFPEPSGPDPAALYPSSGVPVSTLPLQGSERLLPEAGQQHPAGCSATLRSQRLSCPSVGTVPQEPPVCGVLSELGEEHFDRAAATLDSQVPPVWECADPPPAASTSTPEVKRPVNAAPKSESKEPKKSGESWFSRWLPVKKRTEAYLPDDKNKSIVWDEKKNQWVNLNEPEEEKKAPPPPPASFPKTPQAGPPGPGGPPAASVNMFSRKAGGARARYVDVLNPSGTQRSEPVLAPVDSFALLAPIQISSDFHVPKPDAETPQASGGAGVGGQGPARGQAHPDPASETKAPSNHPTAGGPPAGAVPLYHPAQFAQASRTGRTGQRK